MSDTPVTLPPALAEMRDEFLALGERDRLLLLLDYAGELPALPARLEAPGLLERVEECQAPVFVTAEVDHDVAQVHAKAPMEAPTTRGFASMLVQGLSGLSVDDVLRVPDDFPQMLGLGRAVSPLRLRGMSALIGRIKRQLRSAIAVAPA